MRWMLVVVLAVGCAGGHTVAVAPRPPHPPIALEGVTFVTRPRAGQLESSREWHRAGPNRAVKMDDDADLRAAFTEALERRLPVDAAAPVHLHATILLQDPGYFEGLSAETTDVTLQAELIDAQGFVYRTITLREPASAPVQRSASRKARLEAALDRLAERLAARL